MRSPARPTSAGWGASPTTWPGSSTRSNRETGSARSADRRPPDALRQLHLEFELQADAVSGIGRTAVLVPHGQSQIRGAEGGAIPRDQPLGRRAVALPSRPGDPAI